MHPLRSLSRIFVPAVLLPSLALAVPVAVNDTFTTPEDVAAGSSAVSILNATFEAGSGAPAFTLPNAWQSIDLKTIAAGGTNLYPSDGEDVRWKSVGFDAGSSTISGWRPAGTMPIQGGGISPNANFAAIPSTLTGLVAGGPNTVNTYLFRNEFTMTAVQAAHPTWNFNLLADDGCIIYINGVEKGRLNYPTNVEVTPEAIVGGQGGSETDYSQIAVNLAGAFVTGTNVVAIELHQNASDSSDAGIDFQMTPTAGDPTAGFTPVEDAFFGTARADFEVETHAPTGGFEGTGALRVQLGNVFAFGGSQAVSAAWRKTFTLASAATVTLSFRHRMISGQDYDNNEYQELICDVNGTQYGTVTAPSTHLAVNYQIGDGNGGGPKDSGWRLSTFNIPLTAGTHTLSLGGYGNAGSPGFGGAAESFEGFFDDVVLAVPGSVSLLANDTGGVAPVTAVKASDPSNGTVTVNADGSFNYVPRANWFGVDTFTYKAVDSTGQSAPATVTINVTSVNDIPVAGADGPHVTPQGEPLIVGVEEGVLVNDTDVETTVLTAVMAATTPPAAGTTVLNANGSFTFTPAPGFAGNTSFTYRASDGTAQSAPATVSITVSDFPDPPTGVADSYTAVKNTPLVVTATVAGNVTDEILPYKSAGWHAYNSLVLANRNLGTSWRTNAYTEDAEWIVGPAELGFGDGDEATIIADNPTPGFDANATDRFATSYFRRPVTIANLSNVTGVEIVVLYDDACAFYVNGAAAGRTSNLPSIAAMPELAWDYIQTGQFNDNQTQTFNLPPSVLQAGDNLIAAEVHQSAANSSDLSFDMRIRLTRLGIAGVLANDADPDAGQTATLTAELAAPPAHGTVSLNANGTFTYTPANGYTGPDAFTYRAKDSTNLTSGVTTASITVETGPNVPPVANPDSYTTDEDSPLLVTKPINGVLANDTDAEEDPFTAVIATQPAHGTITLNPNGTFSYTPVANYNGPDSFTYRATDTKPGAPATVTITVNPVNDAPLSFNDNYSGDPGVPFTVPASLGVLANDSDPDAGTVLTAELVSAPATGTLTLNPNGGFTFTVAAGGVYSFTYKAKDATTESGIATVTISLNAVPVTGADAYSTAEETPLSRAAAQGVLANDNDPEGQPLTAALVANVLHGTLTLQGDGSFDYAPAPNYFGSDSFTYRASDGTRQSAPVTVSLTVDPVNDAPAALADTYGVLVDTPLTISAAAGVLRNDTDVDNTSLTAVLVTPPVTGTLEFAADGSFTYTPAAGFSGTESFTYRASDGQAQSGIVTATLNVTTAQNTVAISEIMYNPPGAAGVQEEFIEIYNYGDSAIDLSGWEFTKGVNFVFPAGTLINGRGYLAIPANKAAFSAKYPAVTAVTSTGWGTLSSLGNGGETIRLRNALGEQIDEVTYADQGDWAVRKLVGVWDATNTPGRTPANGLDTDPGLEWVTTADPDPELGNAGGSSIQLINAALSNKAGQNWSAATPTPGAANAVVAQADSAPLIRDVIHSPAVPDHTQQVYVTARITDELVTGIGASVFYRTWGRNAATPDSAAFTQVPMADNGLRGDGAAGDGVYGAVIPAQALNTVVEFYVQASDAGARQRTWPAPTLDLAGTVPSQNANCLYQVNEEVWTDHRPLYQLVLTGADNASFNAGKGDSQSNVAPNCTVIFRQGGKFDVRYLGGIRARGNSSRGDTPINLRLDIPSDLPWNGRTGFTMNYKMSYGQFLSSRLMECAGVPTEKAGATGMRFNGVNRLLYTADGVTAGPNQNRTFGYYCDLVPRGGDTIKEWFPGNSDGNGYGKIRGSTRWGVSTLPVIGANGWPEGGYVNEGYWKQTNGAQNDWTDLHAWMQSLNAGTADTFHTTIANTVDVDEWCRFLAVATIINHGETNMANGDDDDYSTYFGATDKLCRIIPHDLDTCFNFQALSNQLGDENAPPTVTIYQCTDPTYIDNATLPQMDKFYRNPVLGRKFKAALRNYLDTLFAKPKFDATVDELLDSQWLGNQFTPNGDAIRAHIKSFMDQRRTTIETFLPTAFTAATTLTVQNGLPRSTSATDLGSLGGKIDPARTAEVKVNGIKVTTNPYGSTAAADNSWSAGSTVTLNPGINTLVCTAHDATGAVFASQTVTIWYDAPGVNKSGSLAASETWTAAGGPYNVTASLTVPSGVVLTIEPGTTVFLASGANITVSGGGRILAAGTAAAGITFTRIPSGTGNWGNVTISGATALPTVMSYVTFENNGSVAVHTQNGANVELDHLTFKNTAVGYLSFDGSSFTVSDCIFPDGTAGFELVHGTQGILAGGRGIVQRCAFGKPVGYNDSFDFTGGNRPGPILHVLNCTFNGSEDDMLDLDSTDAWVEGCTFIHCHRNGSSPDSSSGVSGGADNADYSQVTVINNLFYDCDNAVTMKQANSQPNGNSAVLLYNTIVHVTRTGGIDTGSGVVNFDDDNVGGEGKGMYLEGNVVWDIENLTRNYVPANSQLTMINNILPVAAPTEATASGNVVVTDPLLNLSLIPNPATATLAQVQAALKPQPCSPAVGKGADLSRSGIRVQTPPGNIWPAAISLAVGPGGSFTPTGQVAWGYGYTSYKYKLDTAAESAETPVATPLALSGMTAGAHTLSVWGRDDNGIWQATPTVVTFSVQTAPTVVLSEIRADSGTASDFIELYNWGTSAASLAGCSITDDIAVPDRFAFASTVSIPAGGYLLVDATQLGFNLRKGGESITLFAPIAVKLDEVVFGPQISGLSIARSGGAWALSNPTPAVANTAVCELGTGALLRINEWLGNNDLIVAGDFVELFNAESKPVSIAGWSVSQDFRNFPGENTFRPLSFIPAGGFLELIADGNSNGGGDHLNFKVSSIHDSIALLNPAWTIMDHIFVLPGNPDISQGRTPDGGNPTGYLALPTPGFSNASDLTADTAVMNGLRITEIMFDPPGNGAEFIELKSISAAPLTITGVTFASGIEFTFPSTTLAAGAYTVITGDLVKFAAQFPAVAAVQWTGGKLANSGDRIRIETGAYGLGILDFRYEGNWYPDTRTGASLEIVNPAAARNTWGEQSSWQPCVPTPGGPSTFGVVAPPDGSITSAESAILHGFVCPGAFAAGSITVAWSKVSGPGTVNFTAPANRDTDATFSVPGVYELRLTATPPGGAPDASDTVVITVTSSFESYADWTARTLAGYSPAQQAKGADADNDGVANVIEHVMGTNPAVSTAGPGVINSAGHLALRYTVSKTADPAIQVIPQISTAFGTWLDGPAVITDTITADAPAAATHTAADNALLGAGPTKFMRLKVVCP